MSAYGYRAARQDGAVVSGAIDAESRDDASTTLANRGLFALTITDAADNRRPAASRRDLAIVFRGIAALVAGVVPLERAVGASEPLARGSLRDTLSAARMRLREGATLANALAAGNGIVPALVLGMDRAGERGSQLGTALEHVATHLEQEADLV